MSRPKGQCGYVLVTLALVLVVILGFIGLGVDVGVFYSARTAAQRAADSAALAGAFTFIVDPTAPQPDTARQHAIQTAVSNEVLRTSITASQVTVTVDVGNRVVSVQIDRAQPTFFARAMGYNTVNISVRGTAEASRNATGGSCVKPWFIPNTVLSTLAPCSACPAGQVLISNGLVTSFASSKIGSQFTIKPQNPSGALAPGQFYAIQLSNDPSQSGASAYRQNIAQCAPNAVYCQEFYSVKTGNMVGPTTQGVQDLLGPNPDTYLGPGRYRHQDGTISDTSPQLVTAPVWDLCNFPNFCPNNRLPSGTGVTLKIIGYALVFLEGIQGNDVIARFVGASACGTSGSGGAPAPPETGPYNVPVRLIRTQ